MYEELKQVIVEIIVEIAKTIPTACRRLSVSSRCSGSDPQPCPIVRLVCDKQRPIESQAYPEMINLFGKFPVVPYGTPGTDDLGGNGSSYSR
jgi:hypothetical protein